MIIENSKVVRKYKSGYEIRRELWKLDENDNGTQMRQAYTPSGDRIGDTKTAHLICTTKGIRPEKANLDHCVCSIGFCEKEQKWYGWSHRAMLGFEIGDKLFDENWVGDGMSDERDEFGFLISMDNVKFIERGGIVIQSLNQAKQAAINFSDYVS